MKKILTYSVVLLTTVFVGVIIIDLFVLRGYATTQLLPKDWLSDEPIQLDVTYEVRKIDDSNWRLSFSNHTPQFLVFMTYRNEHAFVDLNDSVLFLNAAYYRFSLADTVFEETPNSFSCGTGLGLVLIRPFETFDLEVDNIYYLVCSEIAFAVPHYKLDSRMRENDDVEYQLFLPVRTIGSSKWQNIYSSKFVLSYRRIKEYLAQDEWLKEVMSKTY